MTGKQPKQKDRPGIDRYGRTELHYAAKENDVAKAQGLIKGEVDVNGKDDNGWTALHFAAQFNSVDVAKLLLEAGAEVDPTDSSGNTPLSTAVFNYRGSGDLIELLREKSADPCRENHRGQSPMGLARSFLQEIVMISSSEIAKMKERPSWPVRVAGVDVQIREIRAMSRYRFDPKRISTLKVTTLLLTGSRTASPQLKEAIRGLLDSLPNRSLFVFEGQEHNAMDSVPEQFAEAVVNFLLSTRERPLEQVRDWRGERRP
jgi:uncharacterized protein